MIPRLCLAAFALLATSVLAQQSEPAPAAMPAVPPITCVKPEFPSAFADQRRIDRFNKEYKAYGECTKKYIAETKAASDAYVEAGNKAIDEFNAYSRELDARQAAAKK